jgi:hypothetical protein
MKRILCWRSKFSLVCIIILSMLFIWGCSDNSDDSNPFANTGYNDGKNDDHDHPIKSLTEIGQINNGDAAVAICRGNYVYTAGWNKTSNSFNIIDMSDPTSPVTKGSYNVGQGYGLALNGNYAYIQTDGGGNGIFTKGTVGIMDITDPTNPVPIMENNLGYNSAYQTYYHNGYVYDPSYNIIGIYSVADPANLVHVTNINTTKDTYWLAFSGNYMYGIDKNKLRIWDISDPAAPIETGSISDADLGNYNGIAVKGNHVFVGSNAKILVFDVSDKNNPTLVTTLALTSGTGSSLNEARILDNYLLIVGFDDFYVVDIVNPNHPVEVTSFPLANGEGWGFDVLKNRYAIVGDDTVYHIIKLW